MVQENLTEENLAKCRNVIYSLIKMESKGDQLPVPIQTTANNKTKTLKKEEQYKVYNFYQCILRNNASILSSSH